MKRKELPLFHNAAARRVLSDACAAEGIDVALLRKLIEVQRSYAGSARNAGITLDFDACFAEFLEDRERK